MKPEMKKEYMAPEMEVVEMKYSSDCLLVDSPEVIKSLDTNKPDHVGELD